MQTLLAEARFQQEVRKSKFVANAAPVRDIDEVMAFIARIGDRSATHNCWAYRVGTHYRFNDDGEPSGTAGKPILQALDGQSLDRVAVVVTRWFGGIKLGAGGLVRAYGGTAAECLRLAAKTPIVTRTTLRIRCDFASAAALHARLTEFGAVKRQEHFAADGVELVIDLPAVNAVAFAELVRDLTRGRARIDTEAGEYG